MGQEQALPYQIMKTWEGMGMWEKIVFVKREKRNSWSNSMENKFTQNNYLNEDGAINETNLA